MFKLQLATATDSRTGASSTRNFTVRQDTVDTVWTVGTTGTAPTANDAVKISTLVPRTVTVSPATVMKSVSFCKTALHPQIVREA